MAQTRELAKGKKEDVKFCRCFEGKANNLLMDQMWEIRNREKSSFCFLFKNKETGRMKWTLIRQGRS